MSRLEQRTAAVSVRNVTKRFGPVLANDKVCLDIYRGEILALLGENGSGKTTLMNMLSGIYYPDEGEIYINGKPETSYTFKYDYYWMMGDNRHNSADSRSWGFVPEDHIVGKPILVWLSLDKDRSLFDGGIRWNRLFRWVHPD